MGLTSLKVVTWPPFLKPNVAIPAVNNVRTWALDREVFQSIMRRTAEMRHEQYRNFLRRFATTTANILARPNYHLFINVEPVNKKRENQALV